MLYIDINKILLYMAGGYLATYNLGTSGFLTTVARMTEIGALMLLVGNKNHKKRAFFIVCIILLYQCIIIFTGNRGRAVMYSITVLFVYFNMVKQIRIKDILKISVLAYISGALLTFIGRIRGLANVSSFSYIELLKRSFTEFSPFKILAATKPAIFTGSFAEEYGGA
jgi:hypothetical protein